MHMYLCVRWAFAEMSMDGRTEQHSIALGNTLHTHHSARRYNAGLC